VIYSKLDTELADDSDFIELEAREAHWPWWFVGRVIQCAKRTNRKGLCLKNDGTPMTDQDFAVIHHRSKSRSHEWSRFLEACHEIGLLVTEIHKGRECHKVANWKRWHGSPSDEPEPRAERKASQRERDAAQAPTPSPLKVSTPLVTPPQKNLSREVTSVTTQSRAETEHVQSRSSIPIDKHDSRARVGNFGLASEMKMRPGFWDSIKAMFRQFEPSADWMQAAADAWAFVERNRGQPCGRDVATDADLAAALGYARDATLYEQNRPGRKKPIAAPWSYALSVAQQQIGHAVEHRLNQEIGRKYGQEIGPFVFSPEEAQNCG